MDSCSPVQMGCGAAHTLGLGWFMDLQASDLEVENVTGSCPIALQKSPAPQN